MKNKYIPKKLKFTIILNALYQRNSIYTAYTSPQMLRHVGKVLMPNFDVTKFSELWIWYQQTECNIITMNNDWDITLSYIIDYANARNIKLYSREYFCL